MSGLFLIHAVLRAGETPALAGLAVLEHAPLEFVAAGELQALVSRMPAGAGEVLLADADRATEVAVRHHACLTALSAAHDLAPVRLGAAYAGEDEVRNMLAEGAATFLAALDRTAGAAEFAVKLMASKPTAAAAFLPDVTDGRSFLQRRAAQAQAQRNRADALRSAAAAAFEALAAHARDHAFAGQRKPVESEHEQRLLDVALLVPRAAIPAFEAAVVAAQAEAEASGFALSVAGPLPPYSFVAAPARPELAA